MDICYSGNCLGVEMTLHALLYGLSFIYVVGSTLLLYKLLNQLVFDANSRTWLNIKEHLFFIIFWVLFLNNTARRKSIRKRMPF